MRVRLTLLNMGVLALVLLVLLVAVHYSVRSFLLTTIDRQLAQAGSRAARTEQRVADNPEVREALAAHRALLRQVVRPPAHTFRALRLFDARGRAIDLLGQPTDAAQSAWDARALAQAGTGQALFSTIREDNTQLRIFSQPIRSHGRVSGIVQVAYPLEPLDHLLNGLTLILLVLSPLALLLAGLGGVFLTERALQPVRRITRAAAQLEADDLSQRLPVTGDDEFAGLAVTINGMLARLETAFTRLAQSVEQERRFTADASHELRTPLTTIKAHTSLALRGERSPDAYRKTLIAIDGATDAMTRLTQDLLLLARSDSGQLQLERQPVELQELIETTLAEARHGKEDAQVTVAIAEQTRHIHGDAHHLHRLLVNLLENALRHTPPAGQVTISVARIDDALRLTVADTGEGIAPEHLPHLCERFYRADAARARRNGGTGLGLAICRGIIDAHGGTLAIDSALGQGTTVTVTLPAEG